MNTLHLLRFRGGTALLWMSWKIATAPPLGEAQPVAIAGFWKMVIFQWVNPKSWVVSASAAASYGAADTGPLAWRALTMGTLFMAGIVMAIKVAAMAKSRPSCSNP